MPSPDLHQTFERLRRRHARLSRMMWQTETEAEELTKRSRGRITIAAARQRAGYHAIWSGWSESYDEVAAMADQLVHSRPHSLGDLLMMFGALEWLLLTDAVIVDQTAERQFRAFGRNLRRFAALR